MRATVVAAAGLFLAACTTPNAITKPVRSHEARDSCNADGGELLAGQPVTAELGAQIMASTDATSLRWIPPDTPVTTEYAYGRVSVRYDRDMRITEVTCG